MEAPSRRASGTSGSYVAAAILIAVGVMALAGNLAGSSLVGEAVPLVIGLVFIVVYATTRHYGFLVPGGILTGLGAGILAGSVFGVLDTGVTVVLGLGLGFALIYLVDVLQGGDRDRFWPLIPGGILLLVGGGMATQTAGVMQQLGLWSPAVLIVIGAWILIARARPAPKG
jgi:hypothetical protein